jgi:hypothetical protein
MLQRNNKFAVQRWKIVVAEIGAAHSYLAGPRIERQGLGGGLYVFFTAVAEGWRGPFLFTRLVASFYPAFAQHCGGFGVRSFGTRAQSLNMTLAWTQSQSAGGTAKKRGTAAAPRYLLLATRSYGSVLSTYKRHSGEGAW